MDIPDPLLRRVRSLARRRKTTLRSIVLEGLRQVLEKEGRKLPPFELPDESFGEGGLVDGLVPTDWERIKAIAYEGRGS